MTARHTRLALALLAGAVAVRLVALTQVGNPFDMTSFSLAAAVLTGPDPLGLYSDPSLAVTLFAGEDPVIRWPYPGGYLPFVAGAQVVADQTGHFVQLIRLPTIAADFVLAALLYRHLSPRGESTALAGAALVLLGPLFIAISALHGQLDTLAMLCVASALIVWTRSEPGVRRGLVAGLLLGAGAAIKTFPAVYLVALLPLSRDGREAASLIAAAVAVPLVSLAPFLVADSGGVIDATSYDGVAGLGGISLLVQPQIVESLFAQDFQPALSDASRFVSALSTPVLAVSLLAAGVALRRRPTDAWTGAVFVTALAYVASLNFAFQYGIWIVVLLLFAGRLRAAAAVQALLLLPAFVSYTAAPLGGYGALAVDAMYVPAMALMPFATLWLAGRRRGTALVG